MRDMAGHSPDRRALRAEVDAFLSTYRWHEPPQETLDAHVAWLRQYQFALHSAGLAVVSWPERFGGRGLSVGDAATVAEKLGEAGTPELVNFVGTEVLAPALMRFADGARLARWLPAMADATEIWCQMFSEPDAGSDLAALSTRAARDGAGWRINGQKVWSTWGHYATWGLLLARTGTAEERHRGITAFVVDMATPSIGVRPLRTMTGDEEFAEVFFDDVLIPGDAVVGAVGGGWDVALHILGSERGPYAIRRASVLRGALQELMRTGSASVEAWAAMWFLDRRIADVVDDLDAGKVPGPESALTKRSLTIAEQTIFEAALSSEAIAAVAGPNRWSSAYLYSRASSIYGGSQEIQKNLIAERILGLPRDPR
jgi:alkylation response protein AidB-like acyl-CoA dehydrogenase